jgi:thiol-disulfide isomerase/thioredoxin
MRLTGLRLVGLVVGLAAPGLANPPSAQDILRQSEVAISGLKAVRYQAHGEATGALALRVPKMDGTVTMIRVPTGENVKLRLEAQVVPPMQSQPVTLELASDGKKVTLAEHAAKVFIERDLPGGAALLNNAAPLLVSEFAAARPFEREAKAISLEHAGAEKVGDVDCDIVLAVFAQGGDEVRWFLAKTDHLPRRVQRILQTPMGQTTITTTLQTLDTQPQVKEDAFRLEKPAGFQDPPAGPPGGAGGELLPVGSEAPDWTLKDANGNAVTLKALRGKIVLLDFWATWCMPCRQAMPGVQKLYEKYKDKPVAILGVNCYERGPSDPAGMIKKAGYTYPQLFNANEVATAYHVVGVPSFFLLGPDGKILMASSGYSADRERQIDALIEKTLQGLSGR